MPAVMIRLTAELRPGRGDGRRRAGPGFRRQCPSTPTVVSGWNPCPPFAFERRDCRSGRGGRAVRPRESQVRPPRRYLPVASTGVVSWPSWAPKPQRHSSSGPSSKVRTLSISSESTN